MNKLINNITHVVPFVCCVVFSVDRHASAAIVCRAVTCGQKIGAAHDSTAVVSIDRNKAQQRMEPRE